MSLFINPYFKQETCFFLRLSQLVRVLATHRSATGLASLGRGTTGPSTSWRNTVWLWVKPCADHV